MSVTISSEQLQHPHSFSSLAEEIKTLHEFIDDLNLLNEWNLYQSIVKEHQQIEKLRSSGVRIDY